MALPRELLPNYTVRDYKKWEGDWELIEGIHDEITKKRIYEREGVPYYVLIYPDLLKVKIFKNTSKGFRKIKDLSRETFNFSFEGCEISLDFSKIWTKK